ncbi:HAMP domain-containing sensor histidine kinase [Archangium primigenium]|uniref:HAMP domain-containing sensor histidine kinase n=1 Tax=[Archangium] primigenium TaxID=2792470 RepID=UPI00195F0D58|nr:HAMP domain-containing sensor histidine kinase [Archangium primigenium]MBM7113611.1 HAMP domain-containing histidine kinase [Archangium primigenium]
MTSRRRRVTGRLLFRIGLVCLVQLLLFIMGMDLVRRSALEEPWRRGLERTMAYNVSEWAPLRGQPEALQAALDRVRRRLDMRVSLLGVDGRLISTNTRRDFAPLPPEQLERLGRERVITYTEKSADTPKDRPERLVAVAIPETGPLEAYAILRETKPPPPPTHMMALIGVMLACTAITSLVFAQTLAIPLQRLAGAARAFGEGKLDTRVGMRRRDEFGQVSQAFDEMAERITLLLRSQKELLANVSHELRTPLARIRVALDLANEGDASLARESLADIAEDLGELERLIQDVLTTARLDLTTGQTPGATPPLRRERVEAQVLVDKAAARFRSARPEHRLDVALEPDLPVLEADPVLLRRALDNLLDNAGKYSEPNTTVRLRARVSGGGLEVVVADEGIGIDATDMQHLFTPFFRSDRSRARKTGGVGLGLALARRIVVAHGGSLSLESQPGQGTTARVQLPAAPRA